ncbi:hypothetical protein [Serratia sp. D1N4]
MFGLIVFIVCIAISIYSYKKVALHLRSKGRGKLSTLLIALSCSVFIFMISVAIGALMIGKAHQEKNTTELHKSTTNEENVKYKPDESKNDDDDLDKYIRYMRADPTRTYQANTNELETVFGSNTKILVNNSGKEQVKQFIFDGTEKPVYITYFGKEVLSHWDAVEKFLEKSGKENIDVERIYGATTTYNYSYYYSPSQQKPYLMICNKLDCTVIDMLNVWRLRGELAKDGSNYLKKNKSD